MSKSEAGAAVTAVVSESERLAVPAGFDLQGHRGARGLKPENTLPSFEMALDMGVTTLELDLHLSADGEIVIWHDPFIDPDKCGLKPGAPEHIPDPDAPDISQDELALRDLSAANLRWFQCNRNPDSGRFPDQDSEPTEIAGDSFGIVTLDDLVDFVERYAATEAKSARQRERARIVGYNVETKRQPGDPTTINDGFDGTRIGPFEAGLLEVIEERDLRGRIVVQSFDRRSLEAIHRADPGIRLAALTAGSDVDPAGLAALGASVWSPNASTVGESGLTAAHDAGLMVIPWTVNDLELSERLIKAGVDGLITDRPDLFALP